MKQKYLYIVRHGQTDFNLKGIVQGRGVNSSLNETGIRQAELLYEKYKHVPFDKILTSTLKRTHETVAPFLINNIPHHERVELDEISWGIFEGVEHDAIIQGTYFSILKSWQDGYLHNKVEGGESPLELATRQQPIIEELKDTDYEQILICTHGRAMRALLCGLLDRPLSEMDSFKHDNTCVYKLSFNGKGFFTEMENDLSHLTPLYATI
jgi:probable phosphoglycerate mutase